MCTTRRVESVLGRAQTKSNAVAWNPMEAFNLTVANEDCCLYTYDIRKLQSAACVHKVGVHGRCQDQWTSCPVLPSCACGTVAGLQSATACQSCIRPAAGQMHLPFLGLPIPCVCELKVMHLVSGCLRCMHCRTLCRLSWTWTIRRRDVSL